jgi:hypothetical protein
MTPVKMLNSVRLNDNQKRVIAKIVAAPTPKVAAEEISNGVNLSQARDALVDLGLVVFTLTDHAELTDRGQQVAQEENLVDGGGQLSPDGEKYAYTDEYGKDDADHANSTGSAGDNTDVDGGIQPGSMPAQDPLMMSYVEPTDMSMLRELLYFRS